MNQYNLKFKPGALKSLLEQASGGGAGGGMGAGKDTTGKKKKPYPTSSSWDLAKQVVKNIGAAGLPAPKEIAAAATGRIGVQGFSSQGIEDRRKYYRTIIGGLNPLQWAADAAAMGAKGSASMPVVGNLATAGAGIAQQIATATTDEPANLMTAAYYDPRSIGRIK